jgi:hypothetical protein
MACRAIEAGDSSALDGPMATPATESIGNLKVVTLADFAMDVKGFVPAERPIQTQEEVDKVLAGS